jgi:hypothetical protein
VRAETTPTIAKVSKISTKVKASKPLKIALLKLPPPEMLVSKGLWGF